MQIICISTDTKKLRLSIFFNVLGLMSDPNLDATRDVNFLSFFVGLILHYTFKSLRLLLVLPFLWEMINSTASKF